MKKDHNRKTRANKSLTIAFLAAPNTQILDVAGPYQIFVRAAEIYQATHPADSSPYKMLLIGVRGGDSVLTNCGLS